MNNKRVHVPFNKREIKWKFAPFIEEIVETCGLTCVAQLKRLYSERKLIKTKYVFSNV